MSRRDENPFDLQKASHYSSEEILDHWVDVAEQHGGLVAVLKPTSITPMILLGGKGSGKTHLMRYCSAPVQAARYNGNLLEAIRKERYAGVYVPAEALNTHKFAGKGLDTEAWSAIFSMYFEAWLVTSLLATVKSAINDEFDLPQGEKFEQALMGLFDVPVSISSLGNLLEYLVDLRKRIDFSVNNSAISRNISDIVIPFSNGSLLFGVADAIAETFTTLQNPIFVYLIDELENFTADQQKFLNTLIRYRKGRATIKIGARLYGLRTSATLGSGEPIRPGSEYERVELDKFLRDHGSEYRGFAVQLILRRLQQARLPSSLNENSLSSALAELDTSDYWRATTLELMGSYDTSERERPHIRNFRRKLKDAKVDSVVSDKIVDALRFQEHPLFEKTNLFLFGRRWLGEELTAVDTAKRVAEEALAFSTFGRGGAKDYSEALKHFSSDLLAQLYREARQRLPYAGLDTLIELSEGIPRNLLGILALIYRRALFGGEQPFTGGKISVESQTYGVIESAKFFWDDAQPDADVAEVRDSVEGLALLFRSIRFSDAPSECDLCTFSVNMDKLSERSKSVLRIAENWSHLIRIPAGSKNKNHRSIDAKFQFAPMLAPMWEISHHRRGLIELQPDLANAIFDPAARGELLQLVQNRVAGMNAPRMWQRPDGRTTLL